jgi:hypothetical protein
MKKREFKLEQVELTIQEWQQATRPMIQRNEKKYSRNKKHKNQDEE